MKKILLNIYLPASPAFAPIDQPYDQLLGDANKTILPDCFTHYTISTNYIMLKNPFAKDAITSISGQAWNEFEQFRQAHEMKKVGSWPQDLKECKKECVMLIICILWRC